MHDAFANIACIDPAQCRRPPNRIPITRADVEYLAASISANSQLVPAKAQSFYAAIRPLSDEAAFAAAGRRKR